LFDPLPGSLTGNIKNLSDPSAPVLGYFLVSGASEKRIFIDRSELPTDYYPTSGFDCNQHMLPVLDTFPNNNFRLDPFIDSLMTEGYRIYYQVNNISGTINNLPDTNLLYFAKPFCFNCTVNGTNKVPDFWTEENVE
jgi:hypothetical protein